MRPPGRSLLQESFWRHSHPQLKARSSASHPALDWLYPALAAVAAVEQALLQPSSGLTYGAQFDAQVCLLQLVAQVVVFMLDEDAGAVLAVCVCVQSVGVMLGPCWGHAEVLLGPRWDHAGIMPRPCLGYDGAMLGLCWGHAGLVLGSCWGHAGAMLGSCWWRHPGVLLGSCWGHAEVLLGLPAGI